MNDSDMKSVTWVGLEMKARQRREGGKSFFAKLARFLILYDSHLKVIKRDEGWACHGDHAAPWPNRGWNRRSVDECRCSVLWFVRVGHMKRRWPELQDGPNGMRLDSPPLKAMRVEEGNGGEEEEEEKEKRKRRRRRREWTSPVSKLGQQFIEDCYCVI